MEILNKPINTLKHSDIVEFCQKKVPEGWQIDYKRDFPKDITRHIAAFANSRGGVIIIGVEENRDNGLPQAWDGVDNAAKLVERVYQEAANVEPFPAIEVAKTDEVGGKAFVMIRVFEGTNTPYFAQNDGRVWVRTGNVKNPIDVGSPEWIRLLFDKQKQAEKQRENMLRMAANVYETGLVAEDKRRLGLIAEAKAKKDGSERNYYQNKLGEGSVICTIALQPHFPGIQLISPREMKRRIDEYNKRTNGDAFPDYNVVPMPQGILHFEHSYEGYFECQQLYSQGLLYHVLNVQRVDENGNVKILLWTLADRLFQMLDLAKKFYSLFGYMGNVDGFLTLDNAKDVWIRKIIPTRWTSGFYNEKQSPYDKYSMSIETDTNKLNNQDMFLEQYVEWVRELYWNMGFEDVAKNLLMDFLKECRHVS